MEKVPAIIVDLDGTLCDIDHRLHHIKKNPQDWSAFNGSLDQDKSYFWCLELIAAMKARGYQVYFVTGRTDDCEEATKVWLARHNVSYDNLFMRKFSDFREDSDVKEEIYRNHIKNKANILFVVDDRQSVVERWRKLGLTCLQCAPGKF